MVLLVPAQSTKTIGTTEHRENMECMAAEINKCLQTASFAKKPLLSGRGIKRDDYLFDDEDTLSTFYLYLRRKSVSSIQATK